jgi:hypothetical protein
VTITSSSVSHSASVSVARSVLPMLSRYSPASGLAAAIAAISCSSGSTTPRLRQSAFMQRMEQAGRIVEASTSGSNQPKPRAVLRRHALHLTRTSPR